MSLPSIRNIKLPKLLTENKGLRNWALACLGLLIADLLLYAFFVLPSASGLRSWENRYASLRKRHTEAVLFKKQKQELSGIKAIIPTQNDMPLLIKELGQKARQLNLHILSINYDMPKRSGEDVAMLSFTFPVEGRYPDIKRFLYEVETSGRLVAIQNLDLEEEKGRVKVQMKLMTYIKGR